MKKTFFFCGIVNFVFLCSMNMKDECPFAMDSFENLFKERELKTLPLIFMECSVIRDGEEKKSYFSGGFHKAIFNEMGERHKRELRDDSGNVFYEEVKHPIFFKKIETPVKYFMVLCSKNFEYAVKDIGNEDDFKKTNHYLLNLLHVYGNEKEESCLSCYGECYEALNDKILAEKIYQSEIEKNNCCTCLKALLSLRIKNNPYYDSKKFFKKYLKKNISDKLRLDILISLVHTDYKNKKENKKLLQSKLEVINDFGNKIIKNAKFTSRENSSFFKEKSWLCFGIGSCYEEFGEFDKAAFWYLKNICEDFLKRPSTFQHSNNHVACYSNMNRYISFFQCHNSQSVEGLFNVLYLTLDEKIEKLNAHNSILELFDDYKTTIGFSKYKKKYPKKYEVIQKALDEYNNSWCVIL